MPPKGRRVALFIVFLLLFIYIRPQCRGVWTNVPHDVSVLGACGRAHCLAGCEIELRSMRTLVRESSWLAIVYGHALYVLGACGRYHCLSHISVQVERSLKSLHGWPFEMNERSIHMYVWMTILIFEGPHCTIQIWRIMVAIPITLFTQWALQNGI